MSDEKLNGLMVYVQLMDQAQSEFRTQQKEIEELWAEIVDLSLLALERPLAADEETRLSRVRRQYRRKAAIQLRNLDSIAVVMKAHEAQFAQLSDFRDTEMQEEIFQVLCQRFQLEATRIFGNFKIAERFIQQTFSQKS